MKDCDYCGTCRKRCCQVSLGLTKTHPPFNIHFCNAPCTPQNEHANTRHASQYGQSTTMREANKVVCITSNHRTTCLCHDRLRKRKKNNRLLGCSSHTMSLMSRADLADCALAFKVSFFILASASKRWRHSWVRSFCNAPKFCLHMKRICKSLLDSQQTFRMLFMSWCRCYASTYKEIDRAQSGTPF